MASGTFNYISFDYIVAEVKLELQLINGTAEDSLVKRLAKQVVSSLYTDDLIIKKETTLTSDDNVFELPTDFVSMTHVRSVAVTEAGNQESGNYPLISANAFFTGSPGGTGDLVYTSFMQVVGNKLYFNAGSNISEIKIAYNGLNVDQNGFPLIPAAYERAIVSYCKWKYAQAFPREFDANLRNEFQSEYRVQYRTVKGRAKLLSDSDRQILTNIMNRIV